MGLGAVTAILLFLGYVPLVKRIRSTSRGRLKRSHAVGVVAVLAISLILIGPLAWWVVKDIVDDPIAARMESSKESRL
jgi:hypothetical protein